MFDAARVAEAVGTADSVGAKYLIKMLTFATYAGDPTNNLTPEFNGQYCRDTSNQAIYWASTTASSGWKKLTP